MSDQSEKELEKEQEGQVEEILAAAGFVAQKPKVEPTPKPEPAPPAPSGDEGVADIPKEPEPEPEPEAAQEPVEEPKGKPEEPKEPPKEPEAPQDELTILREQNKLLLEKINSLSGEGVAKQEYSTQPAALEITQDEYNEAFASKEGLTTLLGKVYSKAVEDSLLKSSDTMRATAEETVAMYAEVRAFYEDNEDLLPIKRYFGKVCSSVSAKHPDYEIKQVLEEAAKETREALRIARKGFDKADGTRVILDKNSQPAFAPGSGGAPKDLKAKKSLEGEQAEINELIQHAERTR